MDGYMKRGADLHVPNIVLCGGYGNGLAVHIVNAVLVPAAAFYSTVESLIASLPELSITAEAYFLTRAFRTSFPAGGVVSERQGVSAQQIFFHILSRVHIYHYKAKYHHHSSLNSKRLLTKPRVA